MSEPGLVAILVALITAVGGVAVKLVRPREKDPIRQKDAALATATPAEQLAVAMIEGMQTELRAERRARQRVERKVEDLEQARQQDARQIGTLRRDLEAFMQWAEHLRENWHTLRRQETPPPLPSTGNR